MALRKGDTLVSGSATSTFSSTVMRLNRRMFWKVRATPLRDIFRREKPVASSPAKASVPAVGA